MSYTSPPRNLEWRKNLSQALRAKWQSGTRKPNPPESRRKMGDTLHNLYATGKLKRPKLSPELLARIGRKVSKHHKGKILRKTPMRAWEKKAARERAIARRGPGNPREKEWRLRSPVNQVYIFKNLSHFIRTHPNLFLPEDLPYPSRIQHGIQSICPRKKICVGSWKGWTWYSYFEEIKNNGVDLLDRRQLSDFACAENQ